MATMGFGVALRHMQKLFEGSVGSLADARLLERFASSRDESAFAALVDRHGPMVLGVCKSVLKDAHHAEDAFQATFLVLAKKAPTIRSADTLSAWLYRVAFRIAIQANREADRRMKREAKAMAMRGDRSENEMLATLHEEIDRLAEKHRVPLVLCYLEGQSYEEVGKTLSVPPATVRGRLVRAKEALSARLTRRGVTGTVAALALLSPTATKAAVPEAWARSTVQAALGSSASATATVWSSSFLWAGKVAMAVKVSLAVATMAAVGWVSLRMVDDPKPPSKPAIQAEPPQVAKESTKPDPKPAEMIEIMGRVISPGGKPVANARVHLASFLQDLKPVPRAISGGDGRFTIRVPKSVRESVGPEFRDKFPFLMATASGFAPGWVGGIFRDDAPGEQAVTLVEPGTPIDGRLVDLEGRPVSGARATLDSLHFAGDGTLSAWLEAAKLGSIQGIWRGLQSMPLDSSPSVTTGTDGRFHLDGPGRERVAELVITGPTVATDTLYVMGRDEPEIRTLDKSWVEPRTIVFHSPKFQHAAAPCKPIEGFIRDKDTGKPIAGVRILANINRQGDHTWINGIEDTTDAQGHYRLAGLPKASGYILFLFARSGIPYTNAFFEVSTATPGLEPIPFDMKLKRGVVVKGRVTDKATGKPVSGSVDMYTFADNPLVVEYPGYRQGYRTNAEVQPDGTFQAIALPGRSLLAVRSQDTLYRGGVGAESIKGVISQGGDFDYFDTLPERCHIRDYHRLAELNLDPNSETAAVELEVDPGNTLEITVLDPEGRPLGGTKVQGLGAIHPRPTDKNLPKVEIRALEPSKPRRVTTWHEGLKLVGTLYLKGSESGSTTLTLQPWGTVSGRVVDDEGRPRKSLIVHSRGGIVVKDPETQGVLPGLIDYGRLTTDGDGRFRVEGLIPGLKYGASIADGSRGLGDLFQDLIVKPGEVKDLGDLKAIESQGKE